MSTVDQPILSEIIPFNEHRFDAAMFYLARKYNKTLTQNDMVKIHVMADVYNVLTRGRPIIGGELDPMTHGPVVGEALDRIWIWWNEFAALNRLPRFFTLQRDGKKILCTPIKADSDPDEFSENEISSLERAWKVVMSMGWDQRAKFFHEEGSFMGRAYISATKRGGAMSWDDVVSEFEKENNVELPHIHRAIRS